MFLNKKKNISGPKLYELGKKLIPNGTNLFGKRSELYLPDKWPAYYKNAKGCKITDLDNNKYYDFNMVGIGANVLGYCDKDVIRASKNAINSGNLTTLNPPEDIELAKVLIELHPWADMVRYARTGGEITAIAVRLARAFTQKSHVAICGYHGWHDWYLSANLNDGAKLNDHFLPGLKPLGVPNEMKGLTHAFKYGDISELRKIIDQFPIGTVIMEPLRGKKLEKNFLLQIKELCERNNIVLIFDEVTSGVREYIGGHHMLEGIYPDLALFGKTISNGIPMSVVIGKKEIMGKAMDTFISSTYWTDKSGPAAALATIKKMKNINSPKKLVKIGEEIRKSLEEAASENSLNIKFYGSLCLTSFELEVSDWQSSLTLYTQEMLKLGILSSDRIYANIGHNKKALNYFKKSLKIVFKIIKQCDILNSTKTRLEGSVRDPSFGRIGIKNE